MLLNSNKLGLLYALKTLQVSRLGKTDIINRSQWFKEKIYDFWNPIDQKESTKITFAEDQQEYLDLLLKYEEIIKRGHLWNEKRHGVKYEALLNKVKANTTLTNSERAEMGAYIKMFKIHAMKSQRIKQNYKYQVNKTIENSVNVGANGSICTCPDGQTFISGDHMNAGATVNCIGGILSEMHGPHKKYASRKVICGVNTTSVNTKFIISKVCNQMRASWVEGFVSKYKFISNYMIDQQQRWGNIDEETPGLTREDMS